MLKKIIIYILFLLIVTVAIPAKQVDRTNLPVLTINRPDIIVEKIKLTKLPCLKRGIIRLKIEAWLSNKSSKHTSCCPTEAGKHLWKQFPEDNELFRVWVMAQYGSGVYFKAAGTSTAMGPNKYNQRYQFIAEFNSRYILNIKVVADLGNWIYEKKENNNMKKMYWPPRVKIVN